MVRLSGRLTFVYRFVIPLVLIVGLLIFTAASIFALPKKYADFYVVAIPLVTLFFLPIILVFFRLRDIRYDAKNVRVIDGRKLVTEVMINDVVSADRFFYFLYKITINRNGVRESYLILPKIGEVFMTFGLADAESIKAFRRKINSRI